MIGPLEMNGADAGPNGGRFLMWARTRSRASFGSARGKILSFLAGEKRSLHCDIAAPRRSLSH